MALVEIETFADPIVAQMACGLLASHGIEAVLLGGAVASLALGGLAPVRLMVGETNRLIAQRLFANMLPK